MRLLLESKGLRHRFGLPSCAGDRVFGQAAGCLGSHIIADAASLVPLPRTSGPLAASTLPTAHLTAAAALMDAASVQTFDRQDAEQAQKARKKNR